MEMIENPMVMPEYFVKSKHIPDEVWREMEDRDYQDKIFDEMNKGED